MSEKSEKKTKAPKEKMSVAQALKSLNKQYGPGTIMVGRNSIARVETLPTNIATLDLALGSGLPKGRIIELYGLESSGKTTIALKAIAAAQKSGLTAAFVDAEHALDPGWATKLGVNMETMLFSQPNGGDEALQIAITLLETGQVGLVVVDSAAALIPQAELEGEMSDVVVGAQARMLSKACRKLAPICAKTGGIIIFINQIREKIGVMFGNPEVTPGGRALKFWASCRLEIRRGDTLREGDVQIGHYAKVCIKKNKVAAPFKTAIFGIYYGSPEQKPMPIAGPDHVGTAIEAAVELKILRMTGSNYYYNDTKVAAGKANLYRKLVEDATLYQGLLTDIYGVMRSASVPVRQMSDENYLESLQTTPDDEAIINDFVEEDDGDDEAVEPVVDVSDVAVAGE